LTESPRREPLRFEDADEVFGAMRAAGHRVTDVARTIVETLFAAQGPISAQYIAEGLDGRGLTFEPSSVYRNLERLEDLGAVRHVHLGHGPSLYMLVGTGAKEFLACERCDRVLSLDPTELDGVRDAVRERFGYEAHFGHFPIVGLCPECAALEAREAKGGRRRAEHEHSHGDFVHSHSHSHGESHSH
jgi:Fur family ferric uptake transcriptional regulator